MGPKSLLRPLTAVCICLTLLIILATAQQVEPQGNGKGKSNKPVKKIIRLQPTAVEPGATGIAKIFLKTKGNAKQRLQVVGANLKAGTTYTLFIDGAQVDSDTATPEPGDEEAAVEFIFSKKAKGTLGEDEKPLPPALDPITKIIRVELRDVGGQVVLAGEFPQEQQP
ncbi:MAG TPA: hypothetical protein VNO70_27425 [Blastocatellia bacterium]|nr:hypothetical protein [Blastocatellia bacterium]